MIGREEYKEKFWREKKKRYKQGAILSGIIVVTSALGIYLGFYMRERVLELEEKAKNPTVIECHHHVIKKGENLEDALQYFRTVDPEVSDSEVIAQNSLPIRLNVIEGQDITYCFEKEK